MNQQTFPFMMRFQRSSFSNSEEKKEKDEPTTNGKEEPAKEKAAEPKKEEAKKKPEPKKETKAKSSSDDTTTSSSDEEGGESLSAEDIKKIKKLVTDQDKEIDTLKEQVKLFKEKLVYQLAENDNTIKRYKKEIDSTRDFAISKFAKDLLEVRDNLELAS